MRPHAGVPAGYANNFLGDEELGAPRPRSFASPRERRVRLRGPEASAFFLGEDRVFTLLLRFPDPLAP